MKKEKMASNDENKEPTAECCHCFECCGLMEPSRANQGPQVGGWRLKVGRDDAQGTPIYPTTIRSWAAIPVV